MEKRDFRNTTNDFLKLWNQEFGKDYPLTERLFSERINNSSDIIEEASFAWYLQEELVGILVLKKGSDFDPTVKELAFISLIYVNPKYRNQGIGSMLLAIASAEAKARDLKILVTGCDFDNLFSGVFSKSAHSFFEEQGFILHEKNYNLVTKTYEAFEDKRIKLGETEEEKQAVLDLIDKYFHKRWYQELKYCKPDDLVLAIFDEKIVGFARIATVETGKLPNSLTFYSRYQNLGGLGPLGITPDYQGQGLGKALVQNAVCFLMGRGASDVLVDWTNKISFYQKCGFKETVDEFSVYGKLL